MICPSCGKGGIHWMTMDLDIFCHNCEPKESPVSKSEETMNLEAWEKQFNGRSDRRWLMEMGVAWSAPDPKMRALIEAADWDRQQWSLLFMNLIEEHGTKEEQERLRHMHKESAEETQRNVEKERMELARRIARHQAPGHIE